MQERKPYRLAICSGRYQHIHLIHEFMIDTGLYLAEKVIVFIGEPNKSRTVNNPFTFEERKELIELIYRKEILNDQLIIWPLADLKDLGLELHDWCEYMSSVTESIVKIKPDLIIEGPDKRAMKFFKTGDMNSISEFVVSENVWNGKENIHIRGTTLRYFLKNDDFISWRHCVNEKIYNQYERLRKIILECKE
jgi:nicotinamide mononucleotide adenylyltransferase